MMGEPIVLIGGGGHCAACIDVIGSGNKFSIAGIVDMKEKRGGKVLGYEIFADDADLPALVKDYRNFLITIGQIKSAGRRRDMFHFLKSMGVFLPTIFSPNAYISQHAEIGEGTIIMHRATVNAGARIGRNCIVNTSAVVEHNVIIEDHCHVSTGSIVNGDSRIGEGTFIGSGSVVINRINIAGGVVIGAGAVVTKPVLPGGAYAGNPARRMDRNG